MNAAEAPELGPVTRLVLAILVSAVKKGARAIEMVDHADADLAPVSFLVDGAWAAEMSPPYKLRDAIVETLAGFASLDPRTQSTGRFELDLGGVYYRFDLQLWAGPAIFRVTLRPALKLV